MPDQTIEYLLAKHGNDYHDGTWKIGRFVCCGCFAFHDQPYVWGYSSDTFGIQCECGSRQGKLRGSINDSMLIQQEDVP